MVTLRYYDDLLIEDRYSLGNILILKKNDLIICLFYSFINFFY